MFRDFLQNAGIDSRFAGSTRLRRFSFFRRLLVYCPGEAFFSKQVSSGERGFVGIPKLNGAESVESSNERGNIYKRCQQVPLQLRKDTWGFPKIRGTFLGVPIIRSIVFWGLYWGPLI